MLHQNHQSLRPRPPKKSLLGEVSLNTNASASTNSSSSHVVNPDFRQVNPNYWVKKYRKDFGQFKIYLDTLDEKIKKSLERKIKLLGGTNEPFFCKSCTHLITTKPFYEELSMTINPGKTVDHAMAVDSQDQENAQKPTDHSCDTKTALPKKPNVAKDPSQQVFFDKAHSLGMEVWSVTKMLCVVSALMNKPASHAPGLELGARHETLNKMLLEEKRYGVSTGYRNGQAPRPTYTTFNDYYAKVEDVTGVHCPILVKEFPTPTFDPDTPENERTYPWPKLYMVTDAQVRSPFSPPDRSRQQQQAKEAIIPTQQQQQQQHRQHVSSAAPAHIITATSKPCIPSNTILAHNKHQFPYQQNNAQYLDQENNPMQLDVVHDTLGPASVDQSIHTSIKTPFTTMSTNLSYLTQRTKSTTTTNPTHSQATPHTPCAPLYENMSRMDRRMVNNERKGSQQQPGKEDLKSLGGLRPAVATKAAHDQAERRKKDLARRMARENSKYCENCVAYYQDLDKHLQEESHLAFVRDQNNFKELDHVLESTRRLHQRSHF